MQSKEKPCYAYMVECADGTFYTGWTDDIDKRMKAHNSGRGAKYTRKRTPVKLVYCERFYNKIHAMSREYAIKQLTRQQKLELIAQGRDIMLYKKNINPKLEDGLFENPTSEYRGTPFWAWNGKLSRDTLLTQIEMLRTMGMGGFHMHVRTGLDCPYLDKEFMEHIKACTQKAEGENMLAWLYDEDRSPSGTAGGKITHNNDDFARKILLFTPNSYEPHRPNKAIQPEPGRGQESIRQDNGQLLAVYDIILNDDGTLKSYEQIDENAEAKGTKWYAYMECATADPWFNNNAYVDTLEPAAIEKFIKTTHEKYKKAVGNHFGKTIPAIFTDEPQFTPKDTLDFAREQKDVFLPWTKGLPCEFENLYGESIFAKLPELIWELPDGNLSLFRYRFHNTVTDRFVNSYCAQIGQWCRKNGIAMTGHVMGEPTLESQTQAVGDAMRCYKYFGIPGIDMLCDWHEYNSAKQTASIVHQEGKEGMLSELYGVTGWDYDFRGYKLQGDWQAALGVTVRVPHLTWMTMKGEAKRDYPASIGYQSPWWNQFSMVENHFARLNTALTRGKPRIKVAVVHPIETFWLYWGSSEQTAVIRNKLEEQFAKLTEYLIFGQIDFDFICEADLPYQCKKPSNPLEVGQMSYDAVIVCGSKTMRSTTASRLEAFAKNGGKVIFVGEMPDHIDAKPSDKLKKLYKNSIRVNFDQTEILNALESERFLDIHTNKGIRYDRIIHQLREDGDGLWLFIANGKNPECPDVDDAPMLRFSLKGHYKIIEYDTLTGEIKPFGAKIQGENTVFSCKWHMHDSLLLYLEKGEPCEIAEQNEVNNAPFMLMKPVDISLTEPNMLLLDMAEYALNDGEYQPLEEILRLDNDARRQLNIPPRRKEVVQPYLIEDEKCENYLRLRMTIPCEYTVNNPQLGLEDADITEVYLNGEKADMTEKGWYVDRAISIIDLPALKIGENILEIKTPIGKRTNLEYYYLLGDFGVRVNGTVKTVTAPVRQLGFGDIVNQGLPFYTGNIDYNFEVDVKDSLAIRVPRYRGGLVKVLIDGIDRGNIAFSPYIMKLDDIEKGIHKVTLRLYGVRQNGFAQLHHTPGVYFYQSPNSWRSAGDLWSYEYQFKPMGILKSPEIYGTAWGRKAEHITDRS